MATRTSLGSFAQLGPAETDRVLAFFDCDTRLRLGSLLRQRGVALDIAIPTNFYEACYCGSTRAAKHFLPTACRPSYAALRVGRKMIDDPQERFANHGETVCDFVEGLEMWDDESPISFGLACACILGNCELAQYMLDAGATNMDDGLYAAAAYGRRNTAAMMIERGGGCLENVFFVTCVMCQTDMAEFLLPLMPDMDRCLQEVIVACEYEENEKYACRIAASLISAGAKPDLVLLKLAREHGQMMLAEFIEKKCAAC